MERANILGLCLVAAVCSFSAHAQQVEVTADGQHVLHLTTAQQSALGAYLKTHPGVKLVTCDTAGPDAGWCKTAFANWAMTVRRQKAEPQFPTTAWGDFRGAGVVDFAVALHTVLGRQGEIIVFENVGSNHYKPVVATIEQWGGCLDGMLYHPIRKQLEFWCNTARGTAKWTGAGFVSKIYAGD